ncbi:substrate-binding domain-containing protein [Streptomyces sp. NPDC050121]|uniref:substrate-binding domain-containing protein n=1 Tax=Streptomyces sp. NPDC050121 TaxID=3365601 RepID=UPI00379703B8
MARGAHEPPPLNGAWSAAAGYAADQALAFGGSVTAVSAAGDETAIALMRGLREAGCRQNVSVVGFDANPVFGYVSPPLTTAVSLSRP